MSFDDSWNIPSTCTRVNTASACALVLIIDVTQRNINVKLLGDVQLDVDEDFKNIIIQTLTFQFAANSLQHIVEYVCMEGDDCDWIYVKQKVPPLLNINYQSIYNALKPILYDAGSTTNVSKCYMNDILTDCRQGMCNYLSTNALGELDTTRHCLTYNPTALSINIERRKVYPEPSVHDLYAVGFSCNKDQCNSPMVEANLKHVIEAHQDWIIPPDNACSYLQWNYFLLILLSTCAIFCN